MRVRRFLHVLLLIGAVGLGWQAWLTWSYSRPPLVTNSPNGFPQALPTISQAGAETARKLASRVIEKNLFSPDRRTQKEEKPKPEEEPTVPPPQHLKLVGVFVADDRQEAFFTDASKGGKVVRVMAGEDLDSYHLTRLTHSEATLTLGKGGQEVSLRMDIQKSREAARAPRIVPSRPQSQPKPQLQRERQAQREEQEPAETSAPPPTPTYSSILGGNATPAPVLGSGQAAASLEAASGNGQGEALSIRQNIRQLQRRLREIRRQRARERRQARTDGRDE